VQDCYLPRSNSFSTYPLNPHTSNVSPSGPFLPFSPASSSPKETAFPPFTRRVSGLRTSSAFTTQYGLERLFRKELARRLRESRA
jgi:hypothetical protein